MSKSYISSLNVGLGKVLPVLLIVLIIVGVEQASAELTNPYLAVDPNLLVFDQYMIWINVTFDVDIMIMDLDAGWNLANITTHLAYNSTLLSAENVTCNALWNFTSWTEPEQGDLKLEAADPQSVPSGDLPLATVTFKILLQCGCPPYPVDSHDDSPLTLHDYSLLDSTGSSITTDPALNGLVQVYAMIGGWPDIAIENLTLAKTVVGKNLSALFNVTVRNYYKVDLASNITLYGNSTVIGQLDNIILPYYSIVNLTFQWNTTDYSEGNYTITARISRVLDELNTSNNYFADGWIVVAMIGDLTGPYGWPDGKVDMRDIGEVARLFQVTPAQPMWDSNCDVTGEIAGVPDGKVDMRDISLVARHFGDESP